MTRTIPILIILIAAAVASAPLAAQEAAPRFFIERIEVRDHSRVSPDVVIAESRLREEAEYTEAELRDAASRLTRLPFLLAADFALEKGSERGRHVLVITIIETRSFFYRLDIVPILSPHKVGVDTSAELGGDDTAAALGYRWFIGRRGALHVGLVARESTEFTSGYSAFAIGYTAYDLFDTRAFVTLNLKHLPDAQSGVSPQIVAGIPLSLNQTLTAEYDETRVDYEWASSADFDDNLSERMARLTWSYNTTNHPFVPTQGTLLAAGPFATWRDEHFVRQIIRTGQPPELVLVASHSTAFGVQASALQYWEISDRNSVSAGGEAGLGRVEKRQRGGTDAYDLLYGVAQLGFSRSLWTPERRAQGGDSRVELTVLGRARSRNDDDNRLFRSDDDMVQASAHWVRHSSWGTIRLGAGYSW